MSEKRLIGWVNLASGGILLVISICFFFVPGKSSDVLVRILGSLLVLFGFIHLFSMIREHKKVEDKKENVDGVRPKGDEKKDYIEAEIVKEEKKDDER